MDFTLTPAQLELQERARKAAAPWREHVDRWDLTDEAPYGEISAAIADAGLLGLTMPAEYGGGGLSALDYVVVVEELFKGSQPARSPSPSLITGPTLPG